MLEIKRLAEPLVYAARNYRYPLRRRNRIDDDNMRLVLSLSLPADANCIDVGANYGSILRSFCELAPHGQHVAYEPIPKAAAHLRQTFPMVEVHEAAAGDAPGTSSFVHVLNDEGRSGMLQHHNFEYEPITELLTVGVERLDDLPAEYAPSVIKIDVEGAELQVLNGAQRILSENRPAIFFEHYKRNTEVYGTTPNDLWKLLSESGLRLFDIDGCGPLSLSDFWGRFESGKIWVYVAHR